MPLTREQILDALRTVDDPDLKKDLVTLNMVREISVQGATVSISVELTTPACPMKDRIRRDIEEAVARVARGARETLERVEVNFTADVRKAQERAREANDALPMVKHIVAVGAGKGGVGKSTIAVNLAVGLARMGARTGLLDADIWGPSAPTMLGLEKHRPMMRAENMMVPFEVHGIEAMTIGKLVDAEKPLIWRGPMAHGAFRQLATQTDWSELDYFVIDLPPGTSDVPLTMCQILRVTGAVVVCTPQKVAQDDARRAVRMFQQLGVTVLGVVENMSYFIGDDGKEYDIFGRGGAERMAGEMSLPFLGAVPITMDLRRNSDEGKPLKNWSGNAQLAGALDALCGAVAQQVSIASMSGELVQPTLSVR
jgi:ATP-binding protein involved in chromosome partitioning